MRVFKFPSRDLDDGEYPGDLNIVGYYAGLCDDLEIEDNHENGYTDVRFYEERGMYKGLQMSHHHVIVTLSFLAVFINDSKERS